MMDDRTLVIRVVRSAATAVLLLICFLSLLLTIFASALRATVLDRGNYVSVVDSPAFSQKMMSYLREEMEAECLFYDLPFTVLDDALSTNQIIGFSRVYLENLHNALVFGEKFSVPSIDEAPFIRAVDSFFDTLPVGEKPFDTTAADTVGKELASLASSLLQGGMNETYIRLGNRLFGHPMLHAMARYIPVFVASFLFSMGILLLLSYKRMLYRLYTICFTLGISAAVGTFPFWLLKKYDLTTRLVLADSPFKLYIDSIYRSILDETVYITGRAFVACVALFFVSVVLVSVFGKKRNSVQNVHMNGIDETV